LLSVERPLVGQRLEGGDVVEVALAMQPPRSVAKGVFRTPIASVLPFWSARALNRSRAARRTRLYPLTVDLDFAERDELGFHGRFSSLGRFMSLTAIGVGC